MTTAERQTKNDRVHQLRLMRERVGFAVSSTGRSSIGGIVIAGILALAFHELELLGPVPLANGAVFWSLMIAWGMLCRLAIRHYRRQQPALRRTRRWHSIFTALFALNGAVWGCGTFLLWQPDNILNHFALLLLCILNVGNSVNEHGEDVWFVAAVSLTATAFASVAFLVHPSPVGTIAAVMLPIGLGWFGYMAVLSGRRFAELVLTRLQNQDLAEHAGAARDEALEIKRRAESASNAKTVFLANMSHELRTPLNAIIGFSQIVRDELFGPLGNAKYKDYLGDIERSGQHLLSIINDILDIAKLEAGKVEVRTDWIEPAAFLDEAIRFASGLPYAGSVDIVANYRHGDTMVLGDDRMMRQVVLNLLSNAIKHSPAKSCVTVNTAISGNGNLRIEIADHGVGIAPDLLERVFEAFEQADNSYARERQGTGLGLALVRAFVTAHGGKVWLESTVGVGTTAIVELPTTRPSERLPAITRLAA